MSGDGMGFVKRPERIPSHALEYYVFSVSVFSIILFNTNKLGENLESD